LNTAIPGDPSDTTTPDAMIDNLNAVLVGKSLSDASRARLEDWMFAGKITGNLLHAGLPNGWSVGDKSGSGDHATRNDIGIIKPPRGAPILATVYDTESAEPLSSREQVIIIPRASHRRSGPDHRQNLRQLTQIPVTRVSDRANTPDP
jgi:beta-lactamase class A